MGYLLRFSSHHSLFAGHDDEKGRCVPYFTSKAAAEAWWMAHKPEQPPHPPQPQQAPPPQLPLLSQPQPNKLPPGVRVKARWMKGKYVARGEGRAHQGKFYDGRVVCVDEDGRGSFSYTIKYDDGDEEVGVLPQCVKITSSENVEAVARPEDESNGGPARSQLGQQAIEEEEQAAFTYTARRDDHNVTSPVLQPVSPKLPLPQQANTVLAHQPSQPLPQPTPMQQARSAVQAHQPHQPQQPQQPQQPSPQPPQVQQATTLVQLQAQQSLHQPPQPQSVQLPHPQQQKVSFRAQIDYIKQQLEIEVEVSIVKAIESAKDMMGCTLEAHLPEQVAALYAMITQ
jgi:hypothetical protein